MDEDMILVDLIEQIKQTNWDLENMRLTDNESAYLNTVLDDLELQLQALCYC